MRIRAAAAIGVGLLLAACPPTEKTAKLGMSDSVFVHTMIQLRKAAQDTTLDSIARDSTRRMILRQTGMTTARLDSAALALSAQPARAESLWKAIDVGVEKK